MHPTLPGSSANSRISIHQDRKIEREKNSADYFQEDIVRMGGIWEARQIMNGMDNIQV
jgi:L-alanine-DL-glutamate epimerase-like enolase superfamily enzyme